METHQQHRVTFETVKNLTMFSQPNNLISFYERHTSVGKCDNNFSLNTAEGSSQFPIDRRRHRLHTGTWPTIIERSMCFLVPIDHIQSILNFAAKEPHGHFSSFSTTLCLNIYCFLLSVAASCPPFLLCSRPLRSSF